MTKIINKLLPVYILLCFHATVIALPTQSEAFLFEADQPQFIQVNALVTIQDTMNRFVQRWLISILSCKEVRIIKITSKSNDMVWPTGYYHMEEGGANYFGSFNSQNGSIENSSVHMSVPLFNTLISFTDLQIIEKYFSDFQQSEIGEVRIGNKKVSPLIVEGKKIEGLVINYTTGISKEVHFLRTRTVQDQKVPTKMAVHIASYEKKMLIDLRNYRKKDLVECSNYNLRDFLKGSLDIFQK